MQHHKLPRINRSPASLPVLRTTTIQLT